MLYMYDTRIDQASDIPVTPQVILSLALCSIQGFAYAQFTTMEYVNPYLFATNL